MAGRAREIQLQGLDQGGNSSPKFPDSVAPVVRRVTTGLRGRSQALSNDGVPQPTGNRSLRGSKSPRRNLPKKKAHGISGQGTNRNGSPKSSKSVQEGTNCGRPAVDAGPARGPTILVPRHILTEPEVKEMEMDCHVPGYELRAAIPPLEEGLAAAVKDIPPSAFSISSEVAARSALRLMLGNCIEPSLADDWWARLLMLAVGNAWPGNPRGQSRDGLIAMLRLAAIQNLGEGRWRTRSRLVASRSQQGLAYYQGFDPEAKEGNLVQQRALALEQLVRDYRDERLTAYLQGRMADWSPQSPLSPIRQYLGITRQTEKPVEVVAVRADRIGDTGSNGKFIMDRIGALPLIVLAAMRGINEWLRVYEHEYRHSQANHLLSRSYAHLLFSGLAEGLVEESVGRPSVYYDERMALHVMEGDMPGITQLLIAADLGEDDAMRRVFCQLIGKYGLPGFLDLAAMIPEGYDASILRPMFNSFRISSHDVSFRLTNRIYTQR